MKFSIIVNMARFDTSKSMDVIADEALDLVKSPIRGGFDIIWTAEHHTIELTISPNPFQLLAHWGNHTRNARLGTAVVAAPYWHPIRLAGEAAMCDILTGGRLELGLGRALISTNVISMADGMPQGEVGSICVRLYLLCSSYGKVTMHMRRIVEFPPRSPVYPNR